MEMGMGKHAPSPTAKVDLVNNTRWKLKTRAEHKLYHTMLTDPKHSSGLATKLKTGIEQYDDAMTVKCAERTANWTHCARALGGV